MPLKETSPVGPVNPYGRTKLMIEEILRDIAVANPDWRAICLRYFNPVGAHESGLIGEDPREIPNNLLPFIAQVAIGRLPRLRVFGGDFPTADGTGIRDYVHVTDLAIGHLTALHFIVQDKSAAHCVVNLGTGRGSSVLQVIQAFERATGQVVPYDVVARRAGDNAKSYADTALAAALLGWAAERELDRMCTDVWRWQTANPGGY
jgi:UDP-glucose 4-epimerase